LYVQVLDNCAIKNIAHCTLAAAQVACSSVSFLLTAGLTPAQLLCEGDSCFGGVALGWTLACKCRQLLLRHLRSKYVEATIAADFLHGECSMYVVADMAADVLHGE
jgi:hypothetical protein